jgi:hypothetical protein
LEETAAFILYPEHHYTPKQNMPDIGAPKGEGGGAAAGSPPPTTRQNLKNIDIVATTISKVSRDLHFSLNQPLKSADD